MARNRKSRHKVLINTGMQITGQDKVKKAFAELSTQSDKIAMTALNRTAFDVRTATIRALPTWVNIRRPNFLPKAVAVDKATPARPYAEVGFLKRATLASLLEEGGTRRPFSSKVIAVPTANVKRGKTGSVSQANKPRQLLMKDRYYIADFKSGDGAGIFAKVKKGNFVLLGGSPTDNNAHLFRAGQMEVLKPLIDKLPP